MKNNIWKSRKLLPVMNLVTVMMIKITIRTTGIIIITANYIYIVVTRWSNDRERALVSLNL